MPPPRVRYEQINRKRCARSTSQIIPWFFIPFFFRYCTALRLALAMFSAFNRLDDSMKYGFYVNGKQSFQLFHVHAEPLPEYCRAVNCRFCDSPKFSKFRCRDVHKYVQTFLRRYIVQDWSWWDEDWKVETSPSKKNPVGSSASKIWGY